MRVSPVSFNPNFKARNALKGVIYVKPIATGKTQEGIIKEAMSALNNAEYAKEDVAYLKAMGANPPFQSGSEAVSFLEQNNIPVQYGKFSDKNVHACLARGENGNAAVLINSRYKNSTDRPEILAVAEAISHEAGHAKDMDNSNSIQEELDNLSLNVLTHRSFEKTYPGIFNGQNSFIFSEGVKLYPELFFAPGTDKTALKSRVADKYGHMQAGDQKHPASKLAQDIKELDTLG